MGRSSPSGPMTGGYIHNTFKAATIAAGQADVLIGNMNVPAECILDRIVFRVEGTGGLSAYKVRRKGIGTRVAVGDTQALAADQGALGANQQATFAPDLGNIPDAKRRYAQADQIGFFATSDGTVGNRDIEVNVTFHLVGHAYGQTDGAGADFDTVA